MNQILGLLVEGAGQAMIRSFDQTAFMTQPHHSYEQDRRDKLEKLRALGVDPFGQRTVGLQQLAPVKASYQPEMGHNGGPIVKIAGRIMLLRRMGKLTFATLRDESGDLQVGLDKRRLAELDWKVHDLADLGDLVVVEGNLGVTNKGEVTVWATGFTIASKALLPPPAKWEGLSDVELRYRQRYVDLWANPQVMQLAKLRLEILSEIRTYMHNLGYVEVETPMMQPVHGGANARPFKTHHNALDIPLYMRIAPELYLKRLLVGGFSKIYELNRNFRNEGISPRHNPEFTMLEAYEAFGNYQTMAELVEGLICHLAEKLFGGLKIEHRNEDGTVRRTINLQRPWRRISMVDLVAEKTGWRFTGEPITQQQISQLGTGSKDLRLRDKSPFEQLVEIHEKLVEPTLIDPCFVTHVPSVMIPLAKESSEFPGFAEVYELAINGQEISPGYTELNDPDVQAKHFHHQVGDQEERQQVDEDFLTALRYGMPPAGGLGLGIDRLIMMLTGAESIRDVILFPLMRPQG